MQSLPRNQALQEAAPSRQQRHPIRPPPAPTLLQAQPAPKKSKEAIFLAPLDKNYRQRLMSEEKALLDRHSEMAGKFETRLVETVERVRRNGEEASRAALKNEGVIFANDGIDLAVIVFPDENADTDDLRATLEKNGFSVIRQDTHTLKLAVPLGKLADLAAVDGITNVRTLRPPQECSVITQGQAATLASNWQSGGATGAGVKVAVIDYNFGNYTALQTSGELPASLTTMNFAATAMDAGDNHGAACAEVIYDMAPGASLVLIKVDDITDLSTAVTYCTSNGVSIISCAIGGWDGMSFHDGLAQPNPFSTAATHPVAAVDAAAAGGILWVAAAGNSQEKHSLIDWRDSNANGILDWSATPSDLNVLWLNGSTSIPSGVRLDVILTWNAWPTTNQDFDLLLHKNTGSSWTQVTTGFTSTFNGAHTQNGSSTSYPFEELIYQTTDASAQYAVAVGKFDASTTPKFMLRYSAGVGFPNFYGYGNVTIPEPGSIVIPADAASAFTVGALNAGSYTTAAIEYYSSLGPNNRAFTGGTALTKPDICGPTAPLSLTQPARARRDLAAPQLRRLTLPALLRSFVRPIPR